MNLALGETITLAPVVIFAFNRPDHLKRCIDSLLRNKGSEFTEFWVFVDGPRSTDDEIKIHEVFLILNNFKDRKNWHLRFSEKNLGLANSVITGLNTVFEKSVRVIIIEDDLVASPYFLEYCNFGLDKYEMDQRVASLHGFSYGFNKPEKNPYFLRGADCWGWATWKDRWQLFEADSNKLISQIRRNRLKRKFDLDGVYPYFNMLIRQSRGEVNSWELDGMLQCFWLINSHFTQIKLSLIIMELMGAVHMRGKARASTPNSLICQLTSRVSKYEKIKGLEANLKVF